MVRNYIPVLGAHVRRSRHDAGTVQRAKELLEAGQNNAEVSKATGVSIRQVGKYRRRLRQFGSIELPAELKGKPGRRPKGSEPLPPKEPKRKATAQREANAEKKKTKREEETEAKMKELGEFWTCQLGVCENAGGQCWDWKRNHYPMDENVLKGWARLILNGEASLERPNLDVGMALRDKGATKRVRSKGPKSAGAQSSPAPAAQSDPHTPHPPHPQHPQHLQQYHHGQPTQSVIDPRAEHEQQEQMLQASLLSSFAMASYSHNGVYA